MSPICSIFSVIFFFCHSFVTLRRGSSLHLFFNSVLPPFVVKMEASAENIGPRRKKNHWKNKRAWTDEEDQVLIEVLLDLLTTGKYRAGLGSNQMDLVGTPRGVWLLISLFGMLTYGANGDCAGDHKDKDEDEDEDEGDEEEVEDGGVDKEATQKEVVAVEKIDHQVSISISRSPALASNYEAKSNHKKRKSGESSDELVEVIRESTNMLATEISKSITHICLALENATASEKRSKINGALLKLPGLTMLERHRATRIIGCDVRITDIFFSIRDNEKEEWMKTLIHAPMTGGLELSNLLT